jgi:hypothetical protein
VDRLFGLGSLAALACRSPRMVRTRLSSPALATMPWEYPPGLVRKCSIGLTETSATATAAHSRPIARQASPHSGREIPSSPRRLNFATCPSAVAITTLFVATPVPEDSYKRRRCWSVWRRVYKLFNPWRKLLSEERQEKTVQPALGICTDPRATAPQLHAALSRSSAAFLDVSC